MVGYRPLSHLIIGIVALHTVAHGRVVHRLIVDVHQFRVIADECLFTVFLC